MRKVLLAAAGIAVLAGASGIALAQDRDRDGHRGGLFQSDSNSDGVVTRAEFDAGRDSMFARLDANSDGQLAREEMRAGRHGRRGGGHRGAFMMRGADANEDGQITRDEFLARPIEQFNRLDRNSDGVLSADEQPQRRERGEDDGPRHDRGERPNPDANGDNLISRDEFAAMGGTMFDRLDANDDGQVTREEARAAHPRHGRD